MRIAELCRSKLEQHVEHVFQLERIRVMMTECPSENILNPLNRL